MRRIGMILAAMAAMLAFTAGSALAIPVAGELDQQQTDASSGYWMSMNQYRAQTFTAGMTGTLEGVTIETQVGEAAPAVEPAAAGDYAVEIWATSGGVPSGASALASKTVVGDTGGGVLIVFPSPPSVVAGTQYAIRLVVAAGGEINWLGNCETDDYAGGQALVYALDGANTWQTVPDWANDVDASACQLDFAFQTYVTAAVATPQPSAPVVTPPPTATSTSTAPDNQSGIPFLLVLAGLASAAAFVTIRRYGLVHR